MNGSLAFGQQISFLNKGSLTQLAGYLVFLVSSEPADIIYFGNVQQQSTHARISAVSESENVLTIYVTVTSQTAHTKKICQLEVC